jgi:sporulation protein YlmC with PRC-barrel domain
MNQALEQLYNTDIISPNAKSRKEKKPATWVDVNTIIGVPVENTDGERIGSIRNIMINIQRCNVEYLIVQYGSFLGLGGKLFAIPFADFRLNQARKVWVVNRTKTYLKSFPGFDKSHWPCTNSHILYGDMEC